MVRILILAILVVTPVAVSADENHPRIDFELFDDVRSIGDDAVHPRPAEGETLLLQFWASWCHSCGSLMWDMDELVTRNEGVHYIAVSIDDVPEDARVYVRKHRLYEKYSDRYFLDAGKKLSQSLGVNTVPTIFLVDSEGRVLVRKSGHLNSTDLRDFVSGMQNAR
jgi:thiol-disulfide isomerase/thioredoxin